VLYTVLVECSMECFMECSSECSMECNLGADVVRAIPILMEFLFKVVSAILITGAFGISSNILFSLLQSNS